VVSWHDQSIVSIFFHFPNIFVVYTVDEPPHILLVPHLILGFAPFDPRVCDV
jgi:hypothetical protein